MSRFKKFWSCKKKCEVVGWCTSAN